LHITLILGRPKIWWRKLLLQFAMHMDGSCQGNLILGCGGIDSNLRI
jgi:hypothetical protein